MKAADFIKQDPLKLKVFKDRIYGLQKTYPACAQSKLVSELLEQQTFTDKDMTKLAQLGFVIEVVPAPVGK